MKSNYGSDVLLVPLSVKNDQLYKKMISVPCGHFQQQTRLLIQPCPTGSKTYDLKETLVNESLTGLTKFIDKPQG